MVLHHQVLWLQYSRRCLHCILAICTAYAITISNAHADTQFDHFSTGFPITGLHVPLPCEACHIKGLFKGTPQDCNACHNDQMAPGKSGNHVLSTSACDNCHTTFSWNIAVLDHSSVLGSCRQCHNGVVATGKHARHISTTAECDVCHGTIAWTPFRLDHDAVLGTCGQCHNGVTAKGKHNQHIQTSAECDACHSTNAWSPANGFDHSNAAGRCNNSGCHANTKSKNHVQTIAQCDQCHRTSAWTPATFNHDSVAPGTCRNCHTLPNQHLVTKSECDVCHNTNRWIPISQYVHDSANFPGQHNGEVGCGSCHVNGVLVWTALYRPDCASCHAKQFNAKPGVHIKFEQPRVYYTLSELTNCANDTCHMTKSDGQIVNVSGRHRVNDGNF